VITVATIMISPLSPGRRRRSCNARCHDAKFAKCTCICAGMNHGVGLQQARDNVEQLCQGEREVLDRPLVFGDPAQLAALRRFDFSRSQRPLLLTPKEV